MKISYSPQRFIIFFLLIFSVYLSKGQDKALLKQYTWKQFEIIPSLGISYQTDNFILSPVPQKRSTTDKPSLKSIKALKDTLNITSDKSYFKKIGLMYYALNQKDSGRYYLNEAVARYNNELIIIRRTLLFYMKSAPLIICWGIYTGQWNLPIVY